MAREMLLAAETYIWALQAICQLHRVPFAADLVAQQFPPPYDLVTLQRAVSALGFKRSALRSVNAAGLSAFPVPFIAVLKPAEASSTDSHHSAANSGAARLAIVTKCDGGVISYYEEGRQHPVVSPLKLFSERFAGWAAMCVPEVDDQERGDPDRTARPEFGFGWFIPELLRHRSIWREVLLASLAIQLMALATPLFTQAIIDKVIVHHTISTLIVVAIALAVVVLFTAAMSWVRQYLVLHTGNRIDAVLGSRVFGHLFSLPQRYFERRPTGVLVARVQGVETIREFLSGAAVTLILDIPFLLIFLAIMFHYSVTLTLIAVGVLLAVAMVSLAVTPLLRQRLNRQFLLGARNQAFLTEYVAGMETVKSLQMEPQLQRRFGEYLSTYLEASFRARQLANSYHVVAHMLEQVLSVTILCVGAWMVMTSADFTIGMLVAFQMFAGRLSQPVLHLVGLWQQFQQADIAVRRLGDVMNVPGEPASIVPLRGADGDGWIEIRGLSFRHAENLPYLYKHFSLSIEPGKCVAIMGPSGCGKSTLAKLLQGFYQPDEGGIFIDGRDIRNLGVNELRRNFGVVPQETILFSGTLYDNLSFANPLAGFDRIIEACKLAEIHEAIEQLPQGYQTEIGEHGAGLSGGQKQRIAIARALLKRPRILVFDEATSSLDAGTAEQFARTVNQLRGRVTMLFITHQLPRGLQVDSVVTLGQWGTRMGVVGEDRRQTELDLAQDTGRRP